jgi:hypothetical protein
MTRLMGRELELVAQLRELLLPNRSSGAWPSSVKVEGGGLPDTTTRRRRRHGSIKRVRNKGEQQVEESNNRNCIKRRYADLLRWLQKLIWSRSSNGSLQLDRCRKKQQGTFLVTSVPDFDGYQWRKYGQKQIEGAMYPRYTRGQ